LSHEANAQQLNKNKKEFYLNEFDPQCQFKLIKWPDPRAQPSHSQRDEGKQNVERYEKSVVGGNVSLYLLLFFDFSLFLIL